MSLSFLNQKAIRSAAANSESPLSRCRSLILLVSEAHRSEFTFTVGMMWPKFPGTPSHFIKTVSIRQSAIRPLPFPYQVMSMVGSLWLKNKSTCGTINPYAGHVASHGHVGHVMVKLPCETWWHVISMLDMSWSNSYWNMTIHEHIEHIIGKLPCDTLARHELAKLLVYLTSDMLWDMLGFFIFKLTSSNFEQILLTE